MATVTFFILKRRLGLVKRNILLSRNTLNTQSARKDSFCLKCILSVGYFKECHLPGLQNDHKAIMVEIEEALHKLHSREKAKREQDEAEAQIEAMDLHATPPFPFARVDAVTQGSPACGAVSGANMPPPVYLHNNGLSSLPLLPQNGMFLSKGPPDWWRSHWVWFCKLWELPEPPEYCIRGAAQWRGN